MNNKGINRYFEEAKNLAQQKFYESILASYPLISFGDSDPGVLNEFDQACNNIIDDLLWNAKIE